MAEVPEFLAIGHVARDLDPITGASRVGGTVVYSALTAARLGVRAAILTRVGPSESMLDLLRGIDICNVPSNTTTTFINDYFQGSRRQRVSSIAETIDTRHVPRRYLGASTVHLGPMAREIGPEVARLFPEATVCVSPQGWMRDWDDDGEVRSAPWPQPEAVLPVTDILVLSEQDIADRPGLEAFFATEVPIVIVTQGERGARVRANGRRFHVPAVPVNVVDPTGAGDVYAAAFTIRYAETRDPLDAATFATAAASFVVEAEGISNIATREQVISRRGRWARQKDSGCREESLVDRDHRDVLS